jgi:rare lipoprotein A
VSLLLILLSFHPVTCSYYADSFDGHLTASGSVFYMDSVSVAHRSLPFNTLVLFFNPDNFHLLSARTTDRGPYVPGREFDLSLAAFMFLSDGDTSAGLMECYYLTLF